MARELRSEHHASAVGVGSARHVQRAVFSLNVDICAAVNGSFLPQFVVYDADTGRSGNSCAGSADGYRAGLGLEYAVGGNLDLRVASADVRGAVQFRAHRSVRDRHSDRSRNRVLGSARACHGNSQHVVIFCTAADVQLRNILYSAARGSLGNIVCPGDASGNAQRVLSDADSDTDHADRAGEHIGLFILDAFPVFVLLVVVVFGNAVLQGIVPRRQRGVPGRVFDAFSGCGYRGHVHRAAHGVHCAKRGCNHVAPQDGDTEADACAAQLHSYADRRAEQVGCAVLFGGYGHALCGHFGALGDPRHYRVVGIAAVNRGTDAPGIGDIRGFFGFTAFVFVFGIEIGAFRLGLLGPFLFFFAELRVILEILLVHHAGAGVKLPAFLCFHVIGGICVSAQVFGHSADLYLAGPVSGIRRLFVGLHIGSIHAQSFQFPDHRVAVEGLVAAGVRVAVGQHVGGVFVHLVARHQAHHGYAAAGVSAAAHRQGHVDDVAFRCGCHGRRVCQ